MSVLSILASFLIDQQFSDISQIKFCGTKVTRGAAVITLA